MKRTYEEVMVEILMTKNYPMKPKELISVFQSIKPTVTSGVLRQVIRIANTKSIIVRLKIDGLSSFYCLPQWFIDATLKDEYKRKIYESKQIQVQRPTRSLGRTA